MSTYCVRPLLFVVIVLAASFPSWAQSSGTGALSGTVTDQSGAAIPEATVTAVREATGEVRTVVTNASGNYTIPLLPPDRYRVDVSKEGFRQSVQSGINVIVAETNIVSTHLEVGTATQTVNVEASAEMLKTETSSLGTVTTTEMVNSLPLVTRNFTQIIALNAGVSSEVQNASALGRGNSSGFGAVGGVPDFSANGSATQDNSFQMDGVDSNDIMSTSGFSGGIAIPNPDTIQEFKVQTGQYDAATGRNSGANVDVITKSGANQIHGDLWEYFRNDAMNANDYFFNRAGQPRGVLRQNQYGFAVGGPVIKDKLFYFGSWQGTRQLNGVNSNCSSTFFSPPFTSDRSAAALGQMFAGQRGSLQGLNGPAIAADGSNINPAALALLQLKLPNGQYAIPSPQTVDTSKALALQGFSAYSNACSFSEDQYLFNADYVQNTKSKFSFRFFRANDSTDTTFPMSNRGGSAAPGFPSTVLASYQNYSVTNTYIVGSNLFNNAAIGFHHQPVSTTPLSVFKYSDVGIAATGNDNLYPVVTVSGSLGVGGSGQGGVNDESTYTFQDTLSYIHGNHTFRFGGGYTYYKWNLVDYHSFGGVTALSWPDLLLGLSAAQNGSPFSNVFNSFDIPGTFARKFRINDADAFVQDDWRVTSRLTLNVGLRYELLGQFGEDLGRQGLFDWAAADPTPPATGSTAGYVVASNFAGQLPPGVTRSSNTSASDGDGVNTLDPRFGFAYRLPNSERTVVRGGYGVYHSRIVGYPLLQTILNPPYAQIRSLAGAPNAAATLQNPFAPVPQTPAFAPYSPTTNLGFLNFTPNIRPPLVQTFNLQLQQQLTNSMVLEIGYVGHRGQHLLRNRSFNQADLASPEDPIRGVTTNTLANVSQRLPVEGFSPTGPDYMETEGSSWYNGLQVSLNKRFSKGLQFLASYTYAKDLSTDVNSTNFPGPGGNALGDQNNERSRYGPDQFVRQHRFVVSYLYNLPWMRTSRTLTGRLLGDWAIGGVTTIQSGQWLTITNLNATSVYGISNDRAELAPGCSNAELVNSGRVEDKLTNYFDKSCFAPPPIVGSDGIATGFGNSGVGILKGPSQANFDLSLVKHFNTNWPSEAANVEFRAEAFNAFNHPQFSNPDTAYSDSTFGNISSSAVNPRILQLALKFNF